MSNAWMVRAGRGGVYIEDFEKGFVAIGWGGLGNLEQYKTTEELREKYIEIWGDEKPSRTSNAVAMILKFRDKIKKGDYLISYNSEAREYLFGVDKGEYQYRENVIGSYPQLRVVEWKGKVERDLLSSGAKNSLGSVLTLFSVNSDIVEEFQTIMMGQDKKETFVEIVDEESELKSETLEKSHELIKDKIVRLSPDDLENLTACILRAMGYKTKVSPKGPDRGADVTASPDGLGLTLPRIKLQAKHRKSHTGAPEIREFISVLRTGDSGLFVSTSGFSKDARYEAERAALPVTLIGPDDLVELIMNHYDNFDLEGRALMPLVRVYVPVN